MGGGWGSGVRGGGVDLKGRLLSGRVSDYQSDVVGGIIVGVQCPAHNLRDT